MKFRRSMFGEHRLLFFGGKGGNESFRARDAGNVPDGQDQLFNDYVAEIRAKAEIMKRGADRKFQIWADRDADRQIKEASQRRSEGGSVYPIRNIQDAHYHTARLDAKMRGAVQDPHMENAFDSTEGGKKREAERRKAEIYKQADRETDAYLAESNASGEALRQEYESVVGRVETANTRVRSFLRQLAGRVDSEEDPEVKAQLRAAFDKVNGEYQQLRAQAPKRPELISPEWNATAGRLAAQLDQIDVTPPVIKQVAVVDAGAPGAEAKPEAKPAEDKVAEAEVPPAEPKEEEKPAEEVGAKPAEEVKPAEDAVAKPAEAEKPAEPVAEKADEDAGRVKEVAENLRARLPQLMEKLGLNDEQMKVVDTHMETIAEMFMKGDFQADLEKIGDQKTPEDLERTVAEIANERGWGEELEGKVLAFAKDLDDVVKNPEEPVVEGKPEGAPAEAGKPGEEEKPEAPEDEVAGAKKNPLDRAREEMTKKVEMTDAEKKSIVDNGTKLLEGFKLNENPTKNQKDQLRGQLMMAGVDTTPGVEALLKNPEKVAPKEGSSFQLMINKVLGFVVYIMAIMQDFKDQLEGKKEGEAKPADAKEGGAVEKPAEAAKAIRAREMTESAAATGSAVDEMGNFRPETKVEEKKPVIEKAIDAAKREEAVLLHDTDEAALTPEETKRLSDVRLVISDGEAQLADLEKQKPEEAKPAEEAPADAPEEAPAPEAKPEAVPAEEPAPQPPEEAGEKNQPVEI